MEVSKLFLFAVTVLPLVCTPGPDLFFIAAQGLSGGRGAAARANAGVLLGYSAHAVLGALGVAALVASHPVLFEVLRWTGIAYLSYLAIQLVRSACKPGKLAIDASTQPASIRKGFLTSFLNPKGLLVYFAILPNFMTPTDAVATQAVVLSAIFIGLCAVVYGLIGYVAAAVGQRGAVNDKYRRMVDGFAGGMLAIASVRIATN